MGTLMLPSDGDVYLDSGAFIYSVERVEPYRTLLEPVWLRARARQFTIVSSDLVVLETLVKPLREGDRELEEIFRSLFDAAEVELIPNTRSLWEEAAHLRAETGLKTPDALHAAAAMRSDCALFITNDSDFRRVRGLTVVVLKDLLEEESQA